MSELVEFANGTKAWFLNGELHRINGPAVEGPDGSKAWYLNGERHRIDGPAIEFANGTKQWWINGKRIPSPQIKTNWIKEGF